MAAEFRSLIYKLRVILAVKFVGIKIFTVKFGRILVEMNGGRILAVKFGGILAVDLGRLICFVAKWLHNFVSAKICFSDTNFV